MNSLRLPARAGLILSLAIILGGAQAPTRSFRSDPEAPIVVTGERPTRQQARERAVEFVRRTGVARGETAAARWTDPVCPRVLGIAEPYAGLVARRMRAIAMEAGLRVAREDCRTNVSVSFVGDAAGLMQEIDRRSPTRLNEVPRDLRDAMLTGDAPLRWWYLTETRSRHQTRNAPQAIGTEFGGGGTGGRSAETGSQLDTESLQEYNSSIISTFGARVIIDANVVVDLDRVEGRALEAVAAYAAMVAFAEIRPSTPPPSGSILGMFDGETGARGLTDWDMAFLRALYALPLDRQARRHRGILVREMVEFQTAR